MNMLLSYQNKIEDQLTSLQAEFFKKQLLSPSVTPEGAAASVAITAIQQRAEQKCNVLEKKFEKKTAEFLQHTADLQKKFEHFEKIHLTSPQQQQQKRVSTTSKTFKPPLPPVAVLTELPNEDDEEEEEDEVVEGFRKQDNRRNTEQTNKPSKSPVRRTSTTNHLAEHNLKEASRQLQQQHNGSDCKMKRNPPSLNSLPLPLHSESPGCSSRRAG